MDWIDLVSLILSFIGVIAAIWFIWEKFFPSRKISWRFAEKTAKNMADDMTARSYSPTLIVGIGRGGAIMGSLVSGCLGHKPLLVIDRKYRWEKGVRFEELIFNPRIPSHLLESVFLISGEMHSGKTMKLYYDYFEKLGAQSIKCGVLYCQESVPLDVSYKGFVTAKSKIRLPWMFTKNYARASMDPPEVTILSKNGTTI